MKVFLGLGSNRAFNSISPVRLLESAVERLRGILSGLESSSVYRTAAMYVEEQDDFYNMVVCGEYDGTPRSLLEEIHAVEAELGRDRSKEFRNGPRSVDIDIELFGNLRVNESDLIIPHERISERAFVLVPMLEIMKKNADVHKADIAFYEKKLFDVRDQRIERL